MAVNASGERSGSLKTLASVSVDKKVGREGDKWKSGRRVDHGNKGDMVGKRKIKSLGDLSRSCAVIRLQVPPENFLGVRRGRC